MFLALREIRRAKLRFGLLVGAVALLAFLILFQQALRDALLRGFVGGVRNQSAPVLVFDVDGRRFPQGSSISAELDTAVRGVSEVGAIGAIRQGPFAVRAGERQPTATSVLAYDDPALGAPLVLSSGRLPAAPGEVIANGDDRGRGFRLGETVVVEPGSLPLTVVGTAEGIGLILPTLFTTTPTYLELLRTRNPAATLPPPNVLGVAPAPGVSPAALATALNAAHPDLDALPKAAAADGNPAVQSITQSFAVVFALFGVVVPLVTGLFFLILTLQKAGSLTLLRAVGAPSRRLVAGLLAQVGLVLGLGLGIATALYVVVTRGELDGLVLRPDTAAVLTWIGVLGSLGIASALVSIRRVLAIDPIAATTGAGVAR